MSKLLLLSFTVCAAHAAAPVMDSALDLALARSTWIELVGTGVMLPKRVVAAPLAPWRSEQRLLNISLYGRSGANQSASAPRWAAGFAQLEFVDPPPSRVAIVDLAFEVDANQDIVMNVSAHGNQQVLAPLRSIALTLRVQPPSAELTSSATEVKQRDALLAADREAGRLAVANAVLEKQLEEAAGKAAASKVAAIALEKKSTAALAAANKAAAASETENAALAAARDTLSRDVASLTAAKSDLEQQLAATKKEVAAAKAELAAATAEMAASKKMCAAAATALEKKHTAAKTELEAQTTAHGSTLLAVQKTKIAADTAAEREATRLAGERAALEKKLAVATAETAASKKTCAAAVAAFEKKLTAAKAELEAQTTAHGSTLLAVQKTKIAADTAAEREATRLAAEKAALKKKITAASAEMAASKKTCAAAAAALEKKLAVATAEAAASKETCAAATAETAASTKTCAKKLTAATAATAASKKKCAAAATALKKKSTAALAAAKASKEEAARSCETDRAALAARTSAAEAASAAKAAKLAKEREGALELHAASTKKLETAVAAAEKRATACAAAAAKKTAAATTERKRTTKVSRVEEKKLKAALAKVKRLEGGSGTHARAEAEANAAHDAEINELTAAKEKSEAELVTAKEEHAALVTAHAANIARLAKKGKIEHRRLLAETAKKTKKVEEKKMTMKMKKAEMKAREKSAAEKTTLVEDTVCAETWVVWGTSLAVLALVVLLLVCCRRGGAAAEEATAMLRRSCEEKDTAAIECKRAADEKLDNVVEKAKKTAKTKIAAALAQAKTEAAGVERRHAVELERAASTAVASSKAALANAKQIAESAKSKLAKEVTKAAKAAQAAARERGKFEKQRSAAKQESAALSGQVKELTAKATTQSGEAESVVNRLEGALKACEEYVAAHGGLVPEARTGGAGIKTEDVAGGSTQGKQQGHAAFGAKAKKKKKKSKSGGAPTKTASKARLASCCDRLDSVSKALAQLEDPTSSSTAAVAPAQESASVSVLEQRSSEIAELHASIEAHCSTITTLEANIGELGNAAAAKDATITRLEAEIASCASAAAALEARIAKLEGVIGERTAELAAMRAASLSGDAALAAMQAKIDAAAKERASLEGMVAQLKKNVATERNNARAASEEALSARIKAEAPSPHRDAMSAQLASLRDSSERAEVALARESEKLHAVQASLASAASAKDDIARKLEQVNQARVAADEQLNTAEASVASLLSERDRLAADLTKMERAAEEAKEARESEAMIRITLVESEARVRSALDTTTAALDEAREAVAMLRDAEASTRSELGAKVDGLNAEVQRQAETAADAAAALAESRDAEATARSELSAKVDGADAELQRQLANAVAALGEARGAEASTRSELGAKVDGLDAEVQRQAKALAAAEAALGEARNSEAIARSELDTKSAEWDAAVKQQTNESEGNSVLKANLQQMGEQIAVMQEREKGIETVQALKITELKSERTKRNALIGALEAEVATRRTAAETTSAESANTIAALKKNSARLEVEMRRLTEKLAESEKNGRQRTPTFDDIFGSDDDDKDRRAGGRVTMTSRVEGSVKAMAKEINTEQPAHGRYHHSVVHSESVAMDGTVGTSTSSAAAAGGPPSVPSRQTTTTGYPSLAHGVAHSKGEWSPPPAAAPAVVDTEAAAAAAVVSPAKDNTPISVIEGKLLHKTRLTKHLQMKNYRLTKDGALQRQRGDKWLTVIVAGGPLNKTYTVTPDNVADASSAPAGFVVTTGRQTNAAKEILVFPDKTGPAKRMEWLVALKGVWGEPQKVDDVLDILMPKRRTSSVLAAETPSEREERVHNVTCTPSLLVFPAASAPTVPVAVEFTISNGESSAASLSLPAIAFKVRATRKSRYSVTPAKGAVAPGASVAIVVTMKAVDAAVLFAKGNDKLADQFQVHWTPIADDAVAKHCVQLQAAKASKKRSKLLAAALEAAWKGGVDTTIKLKCGLDLPVANGGTGVSFAVVRAIDTKTTHQFATQDPSPSSHSRTPPSLLPRTLQDGASSSSSATAGSAATTTPAAKVGASARFSKTPGFTTPGAANAHHDVERHTKRKKQLKKQMLAHHEHHAALKDAGQHEAADEVASKYNALAAEHTEVKKILKGHSSKKPVVSPRDHQSAKKALKEEMLALHKQHSALTEDGDHEGADAVASRYNTTSKKHAAVKKVLQGHRDVVVKKGSSPKAVKKKGRSSPKAAVKSKKKASTPKAAVSTPLPPQNVLALHSEKKQLKSAMKALKQNHNESLAAGKHDEADSFAMHYNSTAKRYTLVKKKLAAAGASATPAGLKRDAAPEWIVGKSNGRPVWVNTQTGEQRNDNPLNSTVKQ